jgi:4-carboxymuconolactone decarboxylase
LADDRKRAGDKIRRRVLGDAHVERAKDNATGFDRPFQQFITEGVWGSVWARPQLTLRERSMVTLALLAARGHHEELALHLRATRNTGASEDDIREVLLHVAAYAGVPAANSAIAVAKRVYGEMKAEAAAPARTAKEKSK